MSLSNFLAILAVSICVGLMGLALAGCSAKVGVGIGIDVSEQKERRYNECFMDSPEITDDAAHEACEFHLV